MPTPDGNQPKPKPKPAGPPAPTGPPPPKKAPKYGAPDDPRAGVITKPGPAPKTPYQTWYEENYIYLLPLLTGNPDKEQEILSWAWTADKQNWSDARMEGFIADKIMKGLWNQPQDPNGRGRGGGGGRGGYGGGGGGGGASTAEQIAQAEAEIRNEAGQLGLVHDDNWFKYVATAAVNGKWSNSMVTDFLVKSVDPATVQAGNVTASVDQIKKMASDMLLPITEATAREYASRLLSNEMTADGLLNLFRTQATAAHPWAANVIASGVTMRDYMQPARDAIANELEIDPRDVDVSDPKWQKLVVRQDDKGNTRLATQQELLAGARQRPEWSRTGKAQDLTTGAARMLREFMGA